MPFDTKVFWTVYFTLQIFWVLGLVAAWSINMHTATAMQRRGIHTGLPYLWHFGMWSDVFLVHPLCAYLAAKYGHEWVLAWLWFMVPNGLVAALILQCYVWPSNKTKESQVMDGKVTVAGYVHIPQATIIISILFLALMTLVNGRMELHDAIISLVVVALHMFIGTHIPLKMLKRPWFK
jgi:hypothetical protein